MHITKNNKGTSDKIFVCVNVPVGFGFFSDKKKKTRKETKRKCQIVYSNLETMILQ